MNIFKQLFSFVTSGLRQKTTEKADKEIVASPTEPPKADKIVAVMMESQEVSEPLLTISQAAKSSGVTRQAIYFAIKMQRLNAKRENDVWLISEKDLKDYSKTKYSRSKSRKEGKLIFDKSKGFYSIVEAAKFLQKSTNQIYYLVRMGKLKSHRQGSAIVIQDTELYKYAEFTNKKCEKTLNVG